MRRVFYLLLAIIICGFACAVNNDVHLIRAIDYLNQDEFLNATKEFEKTANWEFDANLWIDVAKLSAYNQFITQNKLSQDILRSVNLYLLEEFKVIARYQFQQGEYSQSINTFLYIILPLQKDLLGENHSEYISSLNNVGMLYKQMGDFATAKEYYSRALSLTKSALGRENIYYASSLNNMGLLCETMGLILQAEQCFLEAIEIYRSLSSEQTPYYAIVLDNLGSLYSDLGDFSKAEDYLLQAFTIRKNTLPTTHSDYVTSINNLGSFYVKIGDYNSAEKYLSLALQLTENIYGKQHPEYATVASNLGSLYKYKGDYSQAGLYYQLSLDIRRATLGETHPSYMASVLNIGTYYEDIKNYAKAEECYLKVLKYRQAKYGSNHLNTAIVLNNLGSVNQKLKNYDKAQKYYQEALQIKEQLGEQHPSYISSLNNSGVAYIEAGNYENAEPYIVKAVAVTKNQVVHSFNYMTEKQRESYWTHIGQKFGSTYQSFSYRYYPQKHSVAAFAYDNELFTKGLLLNSSNAVKYSILESGDTTLIRQWRELSEKRQQILILEQKNQQSTYLTQLHEKAEQLEKGITATSYTYRESQRLWTITWDNVRQALQPNQVAVEYMSIPLTDNHALYCALLLRDTCSYPIMISLFEEKEVTKLIDASDSSHINSSYTYINNGQQLTNFIWSKIFPYINTTDTIYFSPTGLLHQVAIEALPYNETQSMGDIYNLIRISSTRELAMHKQPIQHTSAALYGDIAYQEMDMNTMLALSTKYNDGTRSSSTSSRLVDTSQDFEPTTPLPGTKAEIDSIAPILKKQHIAVKVYAQQEACEESVKALSGQKRNILHISTHGFFLPDDGQNLDPMNRCGLYFAGVDKVLEKGNRALPENVDDGILTAKEISLLDLRDADLVVLSACETGLGDISGEGVFGLQRAFKMAGAQTIIMSLWRIHDDATRMLMTAFYHHYGQTHNKRTAFRAAQQEVRAKYKDPYYWAGFIMLD